MHGKLPWYVNIVNYIVTKRLLETLSRAQKDKLRHEAKSYIWDEPYLLKICSDQVLRHCVPDNEIKSILSFCHSLECGGHYGGQRTAHKVLESEFYWPTLNKDAHLFVKTC